MGRGGELLLVWACVLGGVSSCSEDPATTMSLHVELPIAVGAHADVTVVDPCTTSKSPSCPTAQSLLRIDAVTVDDATVFTVLPRSAGQDTQATVRALRDGTTTLHATGSKDGSEELLHRELVAMHPTRLEVAPPQTCPPILNPQVETPSVIVGVGSTFSVRPTRYFGKAGDRPLYGVGGEYPLSSDVATVDPENGVQLVARTTGGMGAIRPVGGRALSVRVYELAEVTALLVDYGNTARATVGTNFLLTARAEVDGRASCGDDFARTATVKTTETCKVDSVAGHVFEMMALAPGDCVVELGLTGTPHAATATVTIVPHD